MLRALIASSLAFLIFDAAVAPHALADEAARKRMREFADRSVYVVEGGGRPGGEYKFGDAYDRDNGIARSSGLAESTYGNRIIVSDILTTNDERFRADLARIGRSLDAGKIMLSGPHFEAKQRIPLSIPEKASDTCTGPCLDAYRVCTAQPEAAGIVRDLTHDQRWCIYWHFRRDLDVAIQASIRGVQDARHYPNFGDALLDARQNSWRYMVIALGTPVSFYSHNPKKPVGYHYDAKRIGDGELARCTDVLEADTFRLVRGAVECSDFDLKIYSPDLTNLLIREAMRIQANNQTFATYLRDGIVAGDDGDEREAMLQFDRTMRRLLPINMDIVDGGKRHVFKNMVRNGPAIGVYQVFPQLAAFARTWTAALGREVDIKLEYSFANPSYINLPGGPIAVLADWDADYARPAERPAAAPVILPPPAENQNEDPYDDGLLGWYGGS